MQKTLTFLTFLAIFANAGVLGAFDLAQAQTTAIPVVALATNKSTVSPGESVFLSWNSANTSSCAASGAWSGAKPLTGVESVIVTQTSTYTLTCMNASGQTASESRTVSITGQTPVVSLNASDSLVNPGTAVLLTWNAQNATACLASGGWSGSKATSGSEFHTVNQNTTFFLTCTNPAGQTTTVSRTVNISGSAQPSVNLSASQTQVTAPANVTLFWNSQNANSCNVFGGWSGNRPTSGSEVVTVNQNTTFGIVCSNATASASDTETIFTQTGGGIFPAPGVTLTANPGTIAPGGSANLNWGSTNATSCFASGGWTGAKGTAGVEVVSPFNTTTYSITCTGPGGSGSASRIVFVSTVLGDSTTIQFSKLARNVTLRQSNFFSQVEGQGIDVIEFQILVRNTGNRSAVVSLRDELPGDLFYTQGSTRINDIQSVDGITLNGLSLGTINPGEQKTVRFQTVIFFGARPKTVTNRVLLTADGATQTGTANIVIKNRGKVLGAGDVKTGSESRWPWIIIGGLFGTMGLYYIVFKLRFKGKKIFSLRSDWEFQSAVKKLRKQEKFPDSE